MQDGNVTKVGKAFQAKRNVPKEEENEHYEVLRQLHGTTIVTNVGILQRFEPALPERDDLVKAL